MDALSSLYPTYQIGSDGFSWWIGQIESSKKKDPKGSGRYRVRIVGYHPQTCDIVGTDDLPWAITMMPVTSPHTPGGITSVSDQLGPGVWVVGFFLDPDKQQPVIMGSIGRVANSTTEPTANDPTPGETGCKSFTTFIADGNKVPFDQDSEQTVPVPPADAGHPADGTKREADNGLISSSATNFIKAKYAKNTTSNPGGNEWCVEIADKCGKETDLTNTFTRLFSEMLAETQRNDGKLGTYLVGELTGDMNDAIAIGRKYVNKAIRIVRTFIASIKGFILEKIKAGIKDLINSILYPSEEGNALTPVTKFFNDALAAIGCQMEDIGDRLARFLEDLIFGYLFNIYKAAACQVDKFVEGIISKIQSLINELLETVLGPIQAILGAAASVLNIIGDAINYVLELLGINCSGPGKKCSKVTKICTDCSTDKGKGDFLDELLKNITDDLFPATGEDWAQYTCEEAYAGNTINDTTVDFIGGIQDPPQQIEVIRYSINDLDVPEGEIAELVVTRSGKTDISSSVTYSTRDGTAIGGLDYQVSEGILGFSPGEVEKTISVRTFFDFEDEGIEDFFVRIFPDSPGTVTSTASKNVSRCRIVPPTGQSGGDQVTPDGEDETENPEFPSLNPEDPETFPEATVPDVENGSETAEPDPADALRKSYSVVADRTTVSEGEFVTYTITTRNVLDGVRLSYRLFGTGITPSDIVSGTLSGTFEIISNTAKVTVGIAEDADIESVETLIFGIPGTGATASVLILASTDGLSDEEIAEIEDSSSTLDIITGTPNIPTVGEIITDAGGGIMDIPIQDPGDPYVEPPVVIITGNGYRASGIVLTDANGRVSEIRVTDPGFGYKLNQPDVAKKECIIDSFTMLSPGRGYGSAPTVYIDGDPDVAEAVVDEGRVISIRIKNRSLTFTSYPEVIILGGGGYGARFIPSFSCLEPQARVAVGSAKIGTGKYIDCP
jgi:hypothetical protein